MVAQEISSSVTEIISAKKGGTIIIDVTDDVLQNIGNLTRLDAKVSSDLISSIFNSSTSALHDGALIIKDGRIHSAAAYIKSLSQRNLPNKYGSRHRSSLGLSENSDAIVIVVSEERKQVSVFYKGDYEVVDTSDLTTYIARL
ncbi:MAG: hypothetical protein DRP42_02510 [Tenericutes bacterium]|nr:MAG: hypothetical protein DRP42_02510 [Mycoplasmatota bacterium]